MSGDGYGTEIFSCGECNWNTFFQYDEASEDCYFYETRGWSREPESESSTRNIYKPELSNDKQQKFAHIYQLHGHDRAEHAMRLGGFDDEVIEAFLVAIKASRKI